jgi:hypothetical protein
MKDLPEKQSFQHLSNTVSISTFEPNRLMFWNIISEHRLNMDVDLQSLFGLHVTWCAQLYSLAEAPQLPPISPHWVSYTRALLVGKDRRHLFVTPCLRLFETASIFAVFCNKKQGVIKRCRLSRLTNGALVYEPKCGGRGGGGCGVSANEYSCAHGAQINFQTPYLTYD